MPWLNCTQTAVLGFHLTGHRSTEATKKTNSHEGSEHLSGFTLVEHRMRRSHFFFLQREREKEHTAVVSDLAAVNRSGPALLPRRSLRKGWIGSASTDCAPFSLLTTQLNQKGKGLGQPRARRALGGKNQTVFSQLISLSPSFSSSEHSFCHGEGCLRTCVVAFRRSLSLSLLES